MFKGRCGVIVCVMAASLWAETVEKNSVPFSFPISQQSVRGHGNFSGPVSFFSSSTSPVGKRNISFAWSISSTAKKGTISLYTLSGMKVGAIPVSMPSGVVSFDLPSGRNASGLYFATMSYGDFEKTIRIIKMQ